MTAMLDPTKFYIGRRYDLKEKRLLEEPVLYNPDDLTTHAVVVGMTGSGKTGLSIDILEEAALQGIPALLVDPKGDLSNLPLHFPNLTTEEFTPWINADEARREGKSVEDLAGEVANRWKTGLEKWDIPRDRIGRVQEAVDYRIYTPGSNDGFPVSILASLQAPQGDWEQEKGDLREEIASTVTALLGLVGVEVEPMQSREHILLSNIFESAWSQGQDLSLTELVRQVQDPPFTQLGALELDRFYPKEDRFELAMRLNNLLAAPGFQAWIEGDPLDPASLLWTPDQKPRHSIFYLAHLSDRERMFFVTLLLTKVEAWMRGQPGSSTLRAMLYFDEVLGYLPPVANPPSKEPLLRLMKQARGYGLGLLLVTQNPVDLDYKGLGNAGTWFIGKLQAERDKQRLMEGLEGVEAVQSGLDRARLGKTISAIDNRVFLLHNVHEPEPTIFHTRWAMAFLRGPITRKEIGELNRFIGGGLEERPEQVESGAGEIRPLVGTSLTRPSPPHEAGEWFLARERSPVEAAADAEGEGLIVEGAQLIFQPALFAQADVRFLDRKHNIDEDRVYSAVIEEPDRRGRVRWEEHLRTGKPLEPQPALEVEGARFTSLTQPLDDGPILKSIQGDLTDYLYHSSELRVLQNPELELVADPAETEQEFRERCVAAAQAARDVEIQEVKEEYQQNIKRLQEKLSREERELAEDQAEHSGRRMEEMATHLENVLGLFSGSRSRRQVSSSLRKRRMTSKAKSDVEESLEAIADFKAELEALEEEMIDVLEEVQENWEEKAEAIEDFVITPYKKYISVDYFGVLWLPYWHLPEEGVMLPAYNLPEGQLPAS